MVLKPRITIAHKLISRDVRPHADNSMCHATKEQKTMHENTIHNVMKLFKIQSISIALSALMQLAE